MSYDQLKYCVVGAGFYGATMAHLIATQLNEQVLVIDKRDHIGGNCYSEIDPRTGIEYHKYGSHIFHTSNQKVWGFISQFTTFNTYQHHVLTRYQNQIYPMPICLQTINQFYHQSFTPEEAKAFIEKERLKDPIKHPRNLEDFAISQIGRPLYEAFIKGYTQKQWGCDPKTLPLGIIKRLPVRYNDNTRYFDDTYEGIPTNGYTQVFKNMLAHPHISLQLNCDFFDLQQHLPESCNMIYTGPIDQFFNYKYGELGWRTLQFENEIVNTPNYQNNAVINNADLNSPYTRTHEFKHLHPERNYPTKHSFLYHEKSIACRKNESPYYPINTQKDQEKLKRYQADADRLENVHFGGRLGRYRYVDMHHVILEALNDFDRLYKR